MFVPRSTLQPRRDRAPPPPHPARDELPQRLRLRQRALRRGRPADRRGQRQDLGALHARGRPASPPACARRPRTASSGAAHRNRAWPHARRDGPMHGMGTQKALDDSGQAEFDPELGAERRAGGRRRRERQRHGPLDRHPARARRAARRARAACSARRSRARCGRRACTCRSPLARRPPRRQRRSSTATPWAGRSATIAGTGS